MEKRSIQSPPIMEYFWLCINTDTCKERGRCRFDKIPEKCPKCGAKIITSAIDRGQGPGPEKKY